GIDIDVDQISRREQGMSAYDLMLSESQERMLVLVRPDAEVAAREVFDHFELHADRIGTITGSARMRVREHGIVVADLPLKALIDGVPLRTAAAPNLVCTGARPIAVTNCLNFGNPERPRIFGQLQESVRGLADACRALELPVVSGNVSLYNETSERNIPPTPVIGMVGLLDDLSLRCPAGFQEDGDLVFLLGETREELAGTAYLRLLGAPAEGRPPTVSLEMERRLQAAMLDSIGRGVLRCAHDVSDGGLLIALAESALYGGR